MDSYVLFKGNKRVTLKEEDMTTEKIGRIFQVNSSSLFLTDDSNVAIFPHDDGHFSTIGLTERGHYEVHGEGFEEPVAGGSHQPVRFAFHRTPSAAAGSASTARASTSGRGATTKVFQRSIFIGEVVDGKLETSTTLNVRFSEFEASVGGIISKVNEALQQEDTLILTDGQGKKILDSEGTRGSAYWKQSARKIYAVKEEDFLQLQGNKKRRLSRVDDTGLNEVFEKIEEVVLAAQGLQDVVTTIKQLTELADPHRTSSVTLTQAQVAAVKAAFACIICRGTVHEPMVSSCCNSIVGCRLCVEQWRDSSDFCPKCRGDGFMDNTQRLVGLSEAFSALENIL